MTGLAIAAVLLSVHPAYRRTGSASFHLIRQELRERVGKNGRIVLPTSYAYRDSITNSYPIRVFVLMLSPLLLITALVVFWRGHQEPGGGFIAGLILAVTLVLAWLSTPVDRPLTRRRTPAILVASGVTTATITGLIGYFTTHDHSLDGSVSPHSFLSPQHWDIPVLGAVPSATFFDFGVTLCVLGMVLTALNLLGSGQSPLGVPSVEVWPPYDPLHMDAKEEGPLTEAASQVNSYRDPIRQKEIPHYREALRALSAAEEKAVEERHAPRSHSRSQTGGDEK